MSTGNNGGTGGKVVPYTAEEDEIVLARAVDDDVMSEQLGRTVISIKQRRYKLTSTQRRKHERTYTTTEVVQLMNRVFAGIVRLPFTPRQKKAIADVIAMIVADMQADANSRAVRPSARGRSSAG